MRQAGKNKIASLQIVILAKIPVSSVSSNNVPLFGHAFVSFDARLIILDVREDDVRPFVLLIFKVKRRSRHEDWRAIEVACHRCRMRPNKSVTIAGIGGRNPAREFKPALLKTHAQTIFGLQPRGQNVELQGADNPRNRAGSVARQEELDDPFLGHLAQSIAKFFGFHGIANFHPAQNFWRKARDAPKSQLLAFRKRIADAQNSVIWY